MTSLNFFAKLGNFILQLQSTQKAGYTMPVHIFITTKTEVRVTISTVSYTL